MTMTTLVEKIAPKLQAILNERQEDIIEAAGSLPRRVAVRLAFPTLVYEVPNMLQIAIDLIATEFGNMDINDLLEFLNKHAQSK